MVYWVLYGLGQLGLRQYFRKIHRIGAEPVQRGPVVVVSNHFNGLMDLLVVTSQYFRRLWFTAKSTLFDPPGGYIFRALPVLPIYRPEDGFQGDANERTFAATSKLLSKGGGVLVFPHDFPEDFKPGERWLHRLRTGAVRMAFAAEEQNNWQLDVCIQPVGVNYAVFHRVGYSVTLAFGQPIRVAQWRDDDDPRGAVRACTAELESRLQQLTVQVPDRQYTELMELVNVLYARDGADDFGRLSIISEKLGRLVPRYPDLAQPMIARIGRYIDMARALHIRPGDEQPPFQHALRLTLLSPFIIAGIITHYIPHRALEIAARRINPDPYYLGTTRFMMGFLGFPLWYLLLGFLYRLLLPGWWWIVVALTATAVTGTMANRYRSRMNALVARWIPGRYGRHVAYLRRLGKALRVKCDALAAEVDDATTVSERVARSA